YWCYDRHRSVRLVVLVGLAIDQIAQSGLSSLSVIYYSAQLFRSRLSELLRSEMTVPSAIARTLSAGLPRCYYLFISEY
ncbi:hypothetical protein, partial [Klebsiella pneumoniae]|uniref:hypothetical protein n=1 Tax=Klebsiella pneumoniae TaxID=573 RepID=UPI001C70549E